MIDCHNAGREYCLWGNLHAEHGLSLYLETGESKMLFDMGQSDAFVANARSLNVNLAAIDFAVLSHGHYDHGGGLRAFFNTNDHAPVYISRHAFEKHGNTSGGISGLILRCHLIPY